MISTETLRRGQTKINVRAMGFPVLWGGVQSGRKGGGTTLSSTTLAIFEEVKCRERGEGVLI